MRSGFFVGEFKSMSPGLVLFKKLSVEWAYLQCLQKGL